jgi:hypothetical protein
MTGLGLPEPLEALRVGQMHIAGVASGVDSASTATLMLRPCRDGCHDAIEGVPEPRVA